MLRTLSSQVFNISPDSLDYCLTVLKRKSFLLTSRGNLLWFSLCCYHSLFHHTQLQRPLLSLLDDPLPDAVKLLLCPLKVSSSPNWTRPIFSGALTGQCFSTTTTQWSVASIQPNIFGLHCWIMFALFIFEAELIPTQPIPRHYHFEFFPSQVKNISSILAEFHESVPPACLGLLERQLSPWLPNPKATIFWVLY